ncbi:unnamed protein product [Closterium sp. NIES-54]
MYDAIVACYSSSTTAALSRLILPYVFPDLSAFATVEDLITHLRTSDTRYCAALKAEFLDKNPPPMYITLYFIVTRLPDSLRAVRDHFLALEPTNLTVDLLEKHLLAAETSKVAVGAAHGTPRTPFFERCPPSPLAPSYASVAAVDILGIAEVGAASTSSEKHRSSKGKGGKSGGGGSGGGGGEGGGGGGGGGGGSGSGGGSGGFGGGGGGSSGSGGGGSGSGGGGSDGGGGGAVQRGGYGGGQRQQWQLPSETPMPLQHCIEAAALGASEFTLLGTAPAKALHNFMLDSSASRCFFRDITTLTPLPAPVPVRLADPSGGPDAMVTTTTTGGLRVAICTCTHTGRHLATFTHRPGSSLYTLTTEPPQVAASAQVSASGPVAAPCLCRLLSHQTLLWHHRLGHPSLPRLLGMHSHLLVSGLPRSLPPLPPSPSPPCLPCIEGRQRAAPQSSSFPPTTAPLQTLRMDSVSSSASGSARTFLSYICTLTEVVSSPPTSCGTFVVERVSSSRSRAFVHDTSADKLSSHAIPCVFLGFPPDAPGWKFYHPTSRCVLPSQDVTFDKSVLFYRLFPYRAAPLLPPPLFLALGPPPVDPLPPQGLALSGVSQVDPLPLAESVKVTVNSGAAGGGAARGAVSEGAEPAGAKPEGAEPEGAETKCVEPGVRARVTVGSGGTGGAGAAGPRGARTRGTGAARAGGVGGAGAGDPGARGSGVGGAGAGGTGAGDPGAGGFGVGDPGAGPGAGGTGVGGTGAGDHGAGGTRAGDPGAGGAGAGGVGAGGVGAGGTGAGGTGAGGGGTGGAGAEGTGAGGTKDGGAGAGEPGAGGAGAGGAGAGGTSAGGTSQPQLQPDSPLPAPSPYAEQRDSLTERREPESRPASLVRVVCTGRRVPRSRPPPVPGTHHMALRPSSVSLRVPLPSPPASSLADGPDPEYDFVRAASPTVTRLLATDHLFDSAVASALVVELVDFAAACRLDYAASLIAVSESDYPPSVGGECALGTNILEDTQEDFECLAAAVPHLVAMLLAPEGDSDAPDIPTLRSYAEAITVCGDFGIHPLPFLPPSPSLLHPIPSLPPPIPFPSSPHPLLCFPP